MLRCGIAMMFGRLRFATGVRYGLDLKNEKE